MESRRHARQARVAAAIAQEAICTIMSSDQEFESSLKQSSLANGQGSKTRSGGKRDAHGELVSSALSNNSSSLAHRQSMYDAYQVWALKTYGDSAKTKTVTKKKYNRIMKILKGEETNNVENSKFRFWVKAKGFRIGPANLNEDSTLEKAADQVLYVPCSKATGAGNDETVYKRVAVVENFYDIIYDVHVDIEGKAGRHAGQKRTYKAVAEQFAFLPREAVTRFLMSCSDCQKRMHLQGTTNNNNNNKKMISETGASDVDNRPRNESAAGQNDAYADNAEALCEEVEEVEDEEEEEVVGEEGEFDEEAAPLDMSKVKYEGSAACEEEPLNMSAKRIKTSSNKMSSGTINFGRNGNVNGNGTGRSTPSNGIGERWIHQSRNAAASPAPSKITAILEDDDEDDDEDNDLPLGDRLSEANGNYDPERLKAFNMFVRLFVDENLDRLVPISRQPKEKIQAIIESCARQFPEFGERARKRIRTYLKSCRRTKRHKNLPVTSNENGWNDAASPPVKNSSNHVSYHLTSPMAEQILATACENECQNAKRMRLGLKPLAVNASEISNNSNLVASSCATATSASAVQVFQQSNTNPSLLSFPYQQNISDNTTGGASSLANDAINGTKANPGHHYSLNPSEVAAVKQLIAGYRESAAFLLRSADELEQLILQQN